MGIDYLREKFTAIEDKRHQGINKLNPEHFWQDFDFTQRKKDLDRSFLKKYADIQRKMPMHFTRYNENNQATLSSPCFYKVRL